MYWTITLKKMPDVLMSASSYPIICDIRAPFLLLLPKFGHNCWPVIVHGRNEVDELLELSEVNQGLDVGPKCGLRYGPSRFHGYPDSLPFQQPVTHICNRVDAVQCVP